jgi:hypothetical protein
MQRDNLDDEPKRLHIRNTLGEIVMPAKQ